MNSNDMEEKETEQNDETDEKIENLKKLKEEDERAINIPNFGNLKYIDRSVQNLRDQTMILYGAPKSGKSFLIRWLMYLLKDHIPNIIVIAPTNIGNNAYSKIVPPRCIKTNVSVEYLRLILKRQKDAVIAYNWANNESILEKLFLRCHDSKFIKITEMIKEAAVKVIKKIADSNLKINEKKEQYDQVKEATSKKLIIIYKRIINENKKELLQTGKLSVVDKLAIKCLYFNPRLLLIMDDCASSIAEWGKDKAIKEIFKDGRHWMITSIYTMQDDKDMVPALRKSAFISFFMDVTCANAFMETKTNGVSKGVRDMATKFIIPEIFKKNENGAPNYKKLVCNRNDPQTILRYVIADDTPPFRFGDKYLWELCKRIPEKQIKMSHHSPFFA